ncbi:MAG: hypothetical protein ACRYG8_03720 [Janthinobacterium lividum]
MNLVEATTGRAFRVKYLAKHIISNAQLAGDLEKLQVAIQLLHMAEALMWDPSLTQKDRTALAALLVGAHQRFWHTRDQHDIELLPAKAARAWEH